MTAAGLPDLSAIGAVVTGSHIVYTSGKHGASYVNKDALYPHTHLASQLGRALAQAFVNDNVDIVLAPAVGAIVLGQWTAFHLSELTGKNILSVYAEQTAEKGFVIKRGYDQLIRGKRTLVIEDVITTGGSVTKVIRLAREMGAEVIGAGALCNRGRITAEGIGKVPRLETLYNLPMETWDEGDCPLCQKGVPVNTALGKGREYLSRKKA